MVQFVLFQFSFNYWAGALYIIITDYIYAMYSRQVVNRDNQINVSYVSTGK